MNSDTKRKILIFLLALVLTVLAVVTGYVPALAAIVLYIAILKTAELLL